MQNRIRPWLMMSAVLLGGIASAVAQNAPAPEPDPTAGDPAASIITFSVPGSEPDATSNAIVVVPREYNLKPLQPATPQMKPAPQKRYPVVYLLHGYAADYTRWYRKTKEAGVSLAALADRFGVIIVMPDGKPASWYLNAPTGDTENPADWQWETVMTRHLVPEIDKTYRTWSEPAGRGITGLSMGGHGAIYLAARHPKLFSACSTMSGVMDLTHSMNKYDLGKRLGPIEKHRDRWVEHSCVTQAERFVGRTMGILLDCGWDDPFFEENRTLHEKLMKLKVPHDYVERPGAHTWEYWINALPYHLQFLADRLKPAGVPSAETTGGFASFKEVIVDKGLPDDPYGIDVADMNDDGKLDIVLVRFYGVLWFEAPTWKRHTIVTDGTKMNSYGIAGDIDGKGIKDLVISADFDANNSKTGGSLWWARGSQGDAPWPLTHMLDEPTIHRMRWADTDGDGKPELIVQPLKGRDTKPPDFDQRGARLMLFRIPGDPVHDRWPMEVIDESLHVSHAVKPVQFDGDKADELLATSFEGVHLFDRQSDGSWRKTRLCEGEQKTTPNRGSSEVAYGRLKGGSPFIATIEPWHGHEVVVYVPPKDANSLWTRFVLDDTFDQGHALGAGDLDGDGSDEIVAGYRGPNKDKGKPTSLKAWKAIDPDHGKWQVQWIDTGDMAAEDLRVVDINADGKLDIVAAGRSTRNLKIYLNTGR